MIRSLVGGRSVQWPNGSWEEVVPVVTAWNDSESRKLGRTLTLICMDKAVKTQA